MKRCFALLLAVTLLAAACTACGGRTDPVSSAAGVSSPAAAGSIPSAAVSEPTATAPSGSVSNASSAASSPAQAPENKKSPNSNSPAATSSRAAAKAQETAKPTPAAKPAYNFITSAVYDDYYYCTMDNMNRLYRMKADGTKSKRLTDETVFTLAIVDDALFYTTVDRNIYTLYRAKPDGSNRSKFFDIHATSFFTHDGWIYYNTTQGGNAFYRIRPDGSGHKKLLDYNIEPTFSGNTIYYDRVGIYRMNPDGTGHKKLTDREVYFAEPMVVNGDWIYFVCDANTGFQRDLTTWRVRTDGSKEEKIYDAQMTSFAINGSYLYFADTDNKFYRMKLDGSGRKRINDDFVQDISIADGWVYYVTHEALYRMKPDGTGRKQLYDVPEQDHSFGANYNGMLYLSCSTFRTTPKYSVTSQRLAVRTDGSYQFCFYKSPF